MSRFNARCRLCPRLAAHLDTVRRKHPGYYARPVPPFGDGISRLLIVGLAPGMHGANRTGRPFTGDHAGILLYRMLHRHGLATRPESRSADDGLKLTGCRIANAVKCLPPANKPLPGEIATCNRYLRTELAAMPKGGVLLALGTIAHQAILMALGLKRGECPFEHGRHYRLPNGLHLVDCYHLSRLNTQTGRLTETMFDKVLRRAVKLSHA